jgi:hypothetical protein
MRWRTGAGLVVASAAGVFLSAGVAQRDPAPRAILEAHLSHGIGESPFDSDVWHDPTNAALIVRARGGATAAELQLIAGGEEELGSRLASLQKHGFLQRDGTIVRSAFPVLIGRDRERYMRIVSDAAARIERQTRSHWQALVNRISAAGWREWAYHFVWSQTMDSGFTWAPMMDEQRVPPLSTLIVWVVYPAHPFKSGTNYFPDTELRDRMLAVTWRPGAANTIERIGREWPAVLSAAVNGRATEAERSRLAALGLVGDDGRIRVPVVKKEDALYARLEALGREHVRLVATHLPIPELRALSGADDKVTFAMAYHDVSWEIVSRMVNAGMFAPPAALRQGASDDAPMRGVCAVVDAHPVFLHELKKALGIQ